MEPKARTLFGAPGAWRCLRALADEDNGRLLTVTRRTLAVVDKLRLRMEHMRL